MIVTLLSGCFVGLIKDPNTITDWINLPEEGTKLTYYEIEYINGNEQSTKSSNATVTNVYENEDYLSVCYADSRGYDYYHTLDYKNNRFLYGDQKGLGYDDIILLDSPVQVGTSWYDYSGSDRICEITEIGVIKTVDAGTFRDVIVVESEYSDAFGEYYDYYYISSDSGVLIYYMSQFTDNAGNIFNTHLELTDID